MHKCPFRYTRWRQLNQPHTFWCVWGSVHCKCFMLAVLNLLFLLPAVWNTFHYLIIVCHRLVNWPTCKIFKTETGKCIVKFCYKSLYIIVHHNIIYLSRSIICLFVCNKIKWKSQLHIVTLPGLSDKQQGSACLTCTL